MISSKEAFGITESFTYTGLARRMTATRQTCLRLRTNRKFAICLRHRAPDNPNLPWCTTGSTTPPVSRGNGSRIIVRDWLESTVPEVEQNVRQWFKDLAIVRPEGDSVRANFKLGYLLKGLVRDKLGELAPQIPTQLLYAALRDTPLPLPALTAALRRQQIDGKTNPARVALIKACLLRQNRFNQPKGGNNMTDSLNTESTDPAYLCGRLLAVFDRLQYLALRGVNAGVVERFYASASTTPALVMGRLFRNAQNHLAKVGGGAAENVCKDFEAISVQLGDHFPPQPRSRRSGSLRPRFLPPRSRISTSRSGAKREKDR